MGVFNVVSPRSPQVLVLTQQCLMPEDPAFRMKQISKSAVVLLPWAASGLVGLMTLLASSWRAPNQSFSREARFLSSLSVQAAEKQRGGTVSPGLSPLVHSSPSQWGAVSKALLKHASLSSHSVTPYPHSDTRPKV